MRKEDSDELTAAFFAAQMRMQMKIVAMAYEVAHDAIKANAELKAARREAEYQNRMFEVLRAPSQAQGTDR
jgi:hypothetical protein